jgi:hypothetical protein
MKNSNSEYPNVSNAKLLLWVLQTFAALQLIELGLKPIVIERKDVRGRRRDLKISM